MREDPVLSEDPVLRAALWLLGVCSSEPGAEAFAGDLLELFHAGRSRWWCFAQALARSSSVAEQRLRMLMLPLGYCVGFVFLHPLWQRLYAPSVTGLLLKYRGTIQWPGSAVLEMTAGLLPAVLFVWVGVFVYALLQRQSFENHPARVLLSLNVGVCLLFAAMMLRLDVMQHDLRLLSRADFFYPLTHARFSILLLVSLSGAVLILPRDRRSTRPRLRAARLLRLRLERVVRSTGLATPGGSTRAELAAAGLCGRQR